MKNKFKYLFVIFFLFKFGNAQFLDKNYYLLDSLEQKSISNPDFVVLNKYLSAYQQAKTDTAKYAKLVEMVEQLNDDKLWPRYNIYNYKKLKLLVEANNNKIIKDEYIKLLSQTINNLGYYEQNYTGNIEKALNYYHETENLQLSVNDFGGLIITKNNIANILHNAGQTSKAIDIYNNALQIVKNKKLNVNTSSIYNNLGEIYVFLGDTTKAMKCLHQSLNIAIKFNQKPVIAQLLGNIGVFLRNQNKNQLAITYFKRSLVIREEIGDKIGASKSHLNLANIYTLNGKLNLSEEHLKLAEPSVKSSENFNVKYLYNFACFMYNKKLNNQEKSLFHLELAYNFLYGHGSISEESRVLIELLEIYKNTKQYEKAVKAFTRLQTIQNEINAFTLKRNYAKTVVENEFKQREADLKSKQKLNEIKAQQKQKQQQLIIFSILVLLIATFIFSVFIFKSLNINKQKNKIISAQKIEVENQKRIIEDKHKDITDSINYAQRIQSSLIPLETEIQKLNPKIAIHFQPRDVVSGDFYWASLINNNFIFVIADCTGHGVPGAFMSIIGINHLHTIVNEKRITQPHLILNELKKEVVNSLNINDTSSSKKDGMDVAIVSINNNQLLFSGANQSVFIIRNKKDLITLKGDRQPVGLSDFDTGFNLTEFNLQIGDRIILYTDGLVDQFGGESGKKLKSVTVKEWLLQSMHLTISEQKKLITENLNNFKNNFEQTDDISFAILEV